MTPTSEKHPLIVVSAAPHARSEAAIQDIMLDVLIALSPAAVMGAYFFGWRAALIIGLSVASCVFFEALFQKITKRKITVYDLSATVTGVLLAFCLPPTAPPWLPIVGAFVAIVIVKQLFGGLGQNFMNPALAARAFLLAAYPVQMTDWVHRPHGLDAVTAATPLAALREAAGANAVPTVIMYRDALIGYIGGCIGETCAAALLLGGLYLLLRRVISWRIPVSFAAGLMAVIWIFGRDGLMTGFPVYEMLLGGALLGAIFMATDYTTSPVTRTGQLIMGAGCGILTAIIRRFSGGYPEGVTYAILLLNLAVPLIDRVTRPRVFGRIAGKGAAGE